METQPCTVQAHREQKLDVADDLMPSSRTCVCAHVCACVCIYVNYFFSLQVCTGILESHLSELWLKLHNRDSVKENKPTKYFKNTSRLDMNNSTDIKINVKYFLFIIKNI